MSKTALVVDDSLMIRRMVSNSMKQAGFEVTEAANGKEGLKALEGRAFQIILTDINMPEMDGFGFLEVYDGWFQQGRAVAAVVMLTSSDDPQDRRRATSFGCVTHYMVKPLVPSTAQRLPQWRLQGPANA